MHLNLIILVLIASVSAFNPGGTLSVDFNTIREAKNVYFDYILNIVNNATLSNIPLSNGHISNNTFQINDAAEDVTLTPLADNVLHISVTHLNASFASQDLAYKIWFYTLEGALDVAITDISLDLKIKTSFQHLSNGAAVPRFTVIESSITIPDFGIEYTLHSSYFIEFISFFKGIFRGTVHDKITSAVQSALDNQVAPQINDYITGTGGKSGIDGINLDWSMVSAPVINNYELMMGVRGLFNADGFDTYVPPFPAPVMPYINDQNPSKLQVFFSSFMADSLGDAAVKAIQPNVWIPSDALPAGSPIELNTKSLDIFFPGMVAKYGNDSLVDLRLEATKVYDFQFIAPIENMGAHVNASIEFCVHQSDNTNNATGDCQTAVVLDIHDLFAEFKVEIVDMNATLNITHAGQGGLSIRTDTIGNLTDAILQIQQLVDQVLTQALPPINAQLAKTPLIIPSKISTFELKNPTLEIHDQYIEIGVTPHFLAPSEPVFKKPEDIFTKVGAYRYVQRLDNEDNFTMLDTKINQMVENVPTAQEIESIVF